MHDVFGLRDEPSFELSGRAPRVRRMPPGPPVHMGGIKYVVIPVRALWLLSRYPRLLIYLGALGAHCRPSGVTWVSGKRIAQLVGRSQGAVSEGLRKLEGMGLVRRLKSKSRRPKHSVRRMVIFDVDEPLPEGETEIDVGVMPYPFSDDPILRGGFMESHVVHQSSAAPDINDEKLRRRAADAVRERALFEAAQRIAQYFADRRGAAAGEAVAASYSEPIAKKWLSLGFTEPELREHINLLVAEWQAAGLERSRFPYSLGDRRVRAPQRAA